MYSRPMVSQLAIIHRMHSDGVSLPVSELGDSRFLEWRTCLRTILIGEHNDINPSQLGANDEIYSGTEAYIFLLEVICGLRSPIIGETEVHGQYRDFYEKLKGQIPKSLFNLLHQAHVHSKQIRAEFLQGLGSQSYGSYCRKKAKGLSQVHILGSGHLTQELVPWFNKSKLKVSIHVRELNQRAKDLLVRFNALELFSLNEKKCAIEGLLIVAAPVTSRFIGQWLSERVTHISHILDLRGESAQDPLRPFVSDSVNIESLNDIFTTIENSRVSIRKEVERAKESIVYKSLQFAKELADENSNCVPKKRFGAFASANSRPASSKT